VYALVAEGRLGCYRIGLGRGTIKISREQIGQYLQRSLKVPPEGEDMEDEWP